MVLADHPLRSDVNLQIHFTGLSTFLWYSLRGFGHKSRHFLLSKCFSFSQPSLLFAKRLRYFDQYLNGIGETNARKALQKLNVNFGIAYGYFVLYLLLYWSCLENSLTGHWFFMVSTLWVPSGANDSLVDGMGFQSHSFALKRNNKDLKRFLMKTFQKWTNRITVWDSNHLQMLFTVLTTQKSMTCRKWISTMINIRGGIHFHRQLRSISLT